MANGNTQIMDAGATAIGNEAQSPFERAQEANSLATTFERQAMYVSWEIEYGHRSEAVELNGKMQETTNIARGYFGHDANFDFRGLALRPEISGVRPEDISPVESVACLATAVQIANMDHTTIREVLVDMRALALARDAAHLKVARGEGTLFTTGSRSALMREAKNHGQQATIEVDADPKIIDGCLEACKEIKSLMGNQLEEKKLVDEAIKAGREREDAQKLERVTEQAREQEKQKAGEMIDKMLNILQTTYGTPVVSLSGSKGLSRE